MPGIDYSLTVVFYTSYLAQFSSRYKVGLLNNEVDYVTKEFFINLSTNRLFIQYIQGGRIKLSSERKTTLQLYFKTFIEKIKSGNLIM